MTWTGQEKCDCFCGKPAGVIVNEDGAFLFCFAHSYESGLMAPLPAQKPDDWAEGDSNTAEIKALLNAGADKTHPVIAAWMLQKSRLYELVKAGYLEAHSRIQRYLELYENRSAHEEELQRLWAEMDEDDPEEQSFLTNAMKKRLDA